MNSEHRLVFNFRRATPRRFKALAAHFYALATQG